MTSLDDAKKRTGNEATVLPATSRGNELETLPLGNDDPASTRPTNRGDGLIPSGNEPVRYFGSYELINEIARGGMGVVYRARQTSLSRIVALKMILAGQFASSEDIERFYTEAEAAAQLDHPGIVPVFEVGQHESQHYFSMGFVEGQSLQEKIRRGPIEPMEAAKLCIKVAEAIAYAHQKGVIHRDLKPANILLDAEGEPKVTDFGLAKQVESDSNMTRSGTVMGTPAFMPPEQASGDTDNVGPRADVYSLGAVLYCSITGRPPFQAANSLDVLMQVLDCEPVSPQELNPQISRDLNTITLKCLEKSQDRRYQGAQELADDLARFVKGEPILARSVGRTERTWRWCRRNPIVASLIALAVAMLVSGTVISSYFAAVARDEARQAQRARQAAIDSQQMTQRALEKSKTDEERARIAKADAEGFAQQAERNADEARQYLVEAEKQKHAAELAAKEANRLKELSQAMLDRSNNFDISPNGKLIAQGFRNRILVMTVSDGK